MVVSYGVLQGLGTLAAGFIFNSIMNGSSTSPFEQWQIFWIIPLIFATVITVMFAVGFKEKSEILKHKPVAEFEAH